MRLINLLSTSVISLTIFRIQSFTIFCFDRVNVQELRFV